MELYTNPLSPNCRKVDAVAKHLSLPVTVHQVDLSKGEQRSPAFLAINPNGMVPALVDGDVKLWESNAIQCYLASKVDNELWPKTNARYDILRWQAWELAHFGSAARSLVGERLLKPMLGKGEPDEARCEEHEQAFRRFAAVLNGHLEKQKWLVGDGVTLADYCVASSLTYAEPARMPLAEFPQITGWLKALDELPAWRGSAPPPM